MYYKKINKLNVLIQLYFNLILHELGPIGPKGKPGKSGIDGSPGIPGLSAYNYTIDGKPTSEFLTAPRIIGQSELKNITVKEGDNLRLRCVSTGAPAPIIVWQKLDTTTVPMGSWKGNFIK